jgi:cytochrome b6-f complex iron-sulfur subunit
MHNQDDTDLTPWPEEWTQGHQKNAPSTPEQSVKVSRKNFLKMGLGALTGLAALEMAGAGMLFLKPRNLAGEFGGKVTAGAVDSFPPGSVTEFPEGRFFLIRTADGGFLAVYSRCPHLGCTVNWEPYNNRFYCPCHASSFDEVGNLKSPPVPRPLDIFSVRIANETVVVDTGQLLSRDDFRPEQLSYA